MKQPLTLNCDLGESGAGIAEGTDAALMPHIHLVNIACGYHAGDANTMRDTVALAAAHGVSIGAHPSYNDRKHFGRRSMDVPEKELITLIQDQISALDTVAARQGMSVQHVKPHGALYNDMMTSERTRKTVMAAVAGYRRPLPLVLLATGEAPTHCAEAHQAGIALLFEAFADRAYTDAGLLLPRSEPGAVLDKTQMLAQVAQLCEHGTVTTHRGTQLVMTADTLCVHGDTPEGVAAIIEIRALIDACRRPLS